MDDLITFLRARLDEDERAARDASPSPWKAPDEDESDDLWLTREDAYHIYRWEPARVLAEVDAKRRMLDVLADDLNAASGEVTTAEFGAEMMRWTKANALARLLALPYAEHPDYREEWRL